MKSTIDVSSHGRLRIRAHDHTDIVLRGVVADLTAALRERGAANPQVYVGGKLEVALGYREFTLCRIVAAHGDDLTVRPLNISIGQPSSGPNYIERNADALGANQLASKSSH